MRLKRLRIQTRLELDMHVRVRVLNIYGRGNVMH